MSARATVLVVDDDGPVRDALREVLLDEGYAVATARDGFDALAWLADHAPPELILLDMTMPEMDGAAFRARQLADPRLAAIPTVVLTAQASAPRREMRAAGWLRKPISLADLLAQVERHRARRTPAAPGHSCGFYRDDGQLLREAGGWLADGLRRGDGVVAIATRAHCEALRDRLADDGLDPGALAAGGQLALVDAAETLAAVWRGGAVDEARFAALVGGRVDEARARRGRVRAFGEMVRLLWSDGDLGGALTLEEHWNRMLPGRSCELLCGYDADAARDAAPILAQHTDD